MVAPLRNQFSIPNRKTLFNIAHTVLFYTAGLERSPLNRCASHQAAMEQALNLTRGCSSFVGELR